MQNELLAMAGVTHTPAYVLDEEKLLQNLKILQSVQKLSGCKILLAQKAFSLFKVYPLIAKYLSGTTASGLYEARLGREKFPGEVHVYSPAYRKEDMPEIISFADHIIFNSMNQLQQFGTLCRKHQKSIGLRINPECSTQETPLYDPCANGSRLGVTSQQLTDFPDIDGLHFHTLCEQNADALAITLQAVEKNFGKFLSRCQWVNFGGGHHITRNDYEIDLLIQLIQEFSEKYSVQVYLEPGEAVALNAGYLITEVLDIVEHQGTKTLILDTSAACHMPDVLEMPYRPPLFQSGKPEEFPYVYRLSSCTCLAGDIIGDYSFPNPVKIGDRLCFEDMMIYSMVKNNTFNGMPLPDIGILHENKTYEVIRKFNYTDFKERLS